MKKTCIYKTGKIEYDKGGQCVISTAPEGANILAFADMNRAMLPVQKCL